MVQSHNVVKIITNRKVVKVSHKAQTAIHQNLLVNTLFRYSLLFFQLY